MPLWIPVHWDFGLGKGYQPQADWNVKNKPHVLIVLFLVIPATSSVNNEQIPISNHAYSYLCSFICEKLLINHCMTS